MNTILKSESGTFEEAQAIFDGADPDLIPNMADLIQNAERVRIEDMTGTQLGELAHVVAALKSMLTNANTLISGERTRAAEQVAKGIHMDLMGQEAKEYTGLLGLGKRLVNYDMMTARATSRSWARRHTGRYTSLCAGDSTGKSRTRRRLSRTCSGC